MSCVNSKTRLLFSLCIICLSVSVARAADEKIDFATQIRPILSDRCFHCHGPDAQSRAADLRLDEQDAAHDYAIVPGDPESSEVFLRLTDHDPEVRMPPPESNRTVSQEEIELIRRWIKQGAEYQQHWAFQRIEKPSVPEIANDDWSRNEIDKFILAKLRTENVKPNPEAETWRLLRRVSFDLNGLPPTLEQLDAFQADPSEANYLKHVEELLASHHYGERLAAEWLDAARYSDTYGYQVDRDRYVWPWRDWVIRSLNANMPYDEFVTQQIAGDLLPDATKDTILATTFCRLHPQKVEGGSIPEEFRVEYVADRSQTVATAFLGLTMECCRCHDHKYDPLSQREYYQMFAFFNSIDEAGLYSFFTPSVPTPTLLLTDDKQAATLKTHDQQVSDLETALAIVVPPMVADQETSVTLSEPIESVDFEDAKVGGNKSVEGPKGKAVQLTGDDAINLKQGNFQRHQSFSVSLWMNTPDVKERAVIFHRSRAWTDAASRGYELLLEDGKLKWSLIHFWPGNAISIKAKETLPVGEWKQVVVTYDGSSRANGLKIYVDGKPIETEVIRDKLTKQITGGGNDHITIGERFRDRGFTDGLVDQFAVYDYPLTPAEVAVQSGVIPTPEQVAKYQLERRHDTWKEAYAKLSEARKGRNDAYDRTSEIMVMRELESPRPTFLLARGNYDAPTDLVEPKTPEVLPPFEEDWSHNRLGLAKWIVDRDNPLTARVAVNRYWQLLMGEGLVRTPEDFGNQASPPTHPQLLDWLAADFIEHGWDVKRLLRQIVTSSTYRQSSEASQEMIQRDPENKLLARSGKFRLSAEMVRDNALMTSGLLVDEVGGPPAKPYEVSSSFKPVKHDSGKGLYRRSLYTFWQRTSPAPAMMTFDASKRDVCQLKRERTSSPLQALVLLNGPQYVEAAKMLAVRVLKDEKPTTDEDQVQTVFRLLTSRAANPQELELLVKLYAQQKNHFREQPEAAKKLLAAGEAKVPDQLDSADVAALTVVANTVMNFDGSVTRR
ncbi:hypothetical protein C5Y96_23260 [Blastopirellula marina]|uniref:LamG-like jellyroll fold domain-containing protein n=1 Tax=Blastopirellula marina TaxID=124 RepID=A0A2S8F0S2_9BACT|nr:MULTISPECIES: DUF1553 domain-containing protein [Pirellulaceae]PQO25733.1 hypothetical protein C5Y96_23260 [Blastopirellula marina]RCS43416.1 DUF1553 domain-containing protein [Bremerella cremea]